MESSKVKLPKEVSEAIEYFRNEENRNNSEIVWQVHQVDQHTKQGEAMRDYAADNYDDFLRAVVNGYEVEQTPEDKVREYINSRRKEMKSLVEQTPHHTRAKYKREGALEVAKILGIEGVEIHE